MAVEILNVYQAETGNWYVDVSVYGVRQEFKFDHEPTDQYVAVAGYAYMYYGQAAPLVEDDILRIYDPRMILRRVGNGLVNVPGHCKWRRARRDRWLTTVRICTFAWRRHMGAHSAHGNSTALWAIEVEEGQTEFSGADIYALPSKDLR